MYHFHSFVRHDLGPTILFTVGVSFQSDKVSDSMTRPFEENACNFMYHMYFYPFVFFFFPFLFTCDLVQLFSHHFHFRRRSRPVVRFRPEAGGSDGGLSLNVFNRSASVLILSTGQSSIKCQLQIARWVSGSISRDRKPHCRGVIYGSAGLPRRIFSWTRAAAPRSPSTGCGASYGAS